MVHVCARDSDTQSAEHDSGQRAVDAPIFGARPRRGVFERDVRLSLPCTSVRLVLWGHLVAYGRWPTFQGRLDCPCWVALTGYAPGGCI
jgi:hypothetical protein